MLRYLPLGIAFISLFVSVATYFNTVYQQDRELEHKELLIRPRLSFFVSSENTGEKTYHLSLSLRNDGFGPPVIQEIVAGYRLGDKLIRPALVKVATRK